MKIRVGLSGVEVVIGFECETLEQAQDLAESIIMQVRMGNLHLTVIEPEEEPRNKKDIN